MSEQKRQDEIEFVHASFIGQVGAQNLAVRGDARALEALVTAARLKAKGATAEHIFRQTSKMLEGSPYSGVTYGADRKPRVELTDHDAKLRSSALGRSGRGYVGDLLVHPKLYDAYPTAAMLAVEKTSMVQGAGYDGQKVYLGDNQFATSMLAGRPLAKPTAKGAMLHELTHHIQEIERWSPGGTPDDFAKRFPGERNRALRERMYRSLAGEVEAENVRKRAGFTPDERRRFSPADSQALPYDQQIVTTAAGALQEQFGGDLPKGYSVKRVTSRLGETNYQIWKGQDHVGDAFVRDLGHAVQMDTIDIDKAHQRKGISTALYAMIEKDQRKPIVPDETLSAKATRFWQKHRPEMLRNHIILSDGSSVTDERDVLTLERRAAAKGKMQLMLEKKPRSRKAAAKIDDIGEKIGGARKDTAVKTGPKKAKAKVEDARPAWARRYVAMERLDRVTKQGTGIFDLIDTEQGSRYGGRTIARDFKSLAEAERAIPLAAVSRNHRVRDVSKVGEPPKYQIWREVTDRKRVQVVPDSFATRDDAMKFMAERAQQIIETKTAFGEEIIARPEKVMRTGGPSWRKGPVKGPEFVNELGFRGVEFGNWNSQFERQEVMNHAYDAMKDLGKVLGVKPESLTLQNQLGLAFGARGHGGKGAARAHYERDYGAINLTKMSGAGSLAHEWAHAFDHFINRIDNPKLQERVRNRSGDLVFPVGSRDGDYASHGLPGKAPDAIKVAMKSLMDTIYTKPVEYVEDQAKADRFAQGAKNELAERLAGIRKHLAEKQPYGKRFVNPATPEQLAAFDAAAQRILAGETAVEWKGLPSDRANYGRGGLVYRYTSAPLEDIAKVMKEVRGRAGFDTQNHHGMLDYLARDMKRASERSRMLAEASAQAVKVKKVPTSFAMEARGLDEGRVSDYWGTRHEMFARSFSSFVEDRAKALGMQSDFLSFGSDNRYYPFLDHKPFPEGPEREAINRAMQTLIDEAKATGMLKAADLQPQDPYWTFKTAGTPTIADLPAGAFKGTQADFEKLSPGMRREIMRSAQKVDSTDQPPKVADAVKHPGTPIPPQFPTELPPADVVAKLQAMGKAAHAAGLVSAPAGDPEIMKVIGQNKYKATAIMDAWIKGWHGANAATQVGDETPGKIGFQNESTLNAALKAQGKAEVGKAQPQQAATPELTGKAKDTALALQKYGPDPKASKKFLVEQAKTIGIKGASKMSKASLLNALGKGLDKTGAAAMIVAPIAAAAVAYDATRSQAQAAGDSTAVSTGKAAAAGVVAGGATAGVMYGVSKAIGVGMKAIARVAPVAAGPVGLAIGAGLTAYGAYRAYQAHKDSGQGLKAAALSVVGADMLLEIGKPREVSAGPQRLSDSQKQQFAVASEAHKAMKDATPTTGEAPGWSDEARIKAYEKRMQNAGKVAANAPYSGTPRK